MPPATIASSSGRVRPNMISTLALRSPANRRTNLAQRRIARAGACLASWRRFLFNPGISALYPWPRLHPSAMAVLELVKA